MTGEQVINYLRSSGISNAIIHDIIATIERDALADIINIWRYSEDDNDIIESLNGYFKNHKYLLNEKENLK